MESFFFNILFLFSQWLLRGIVAKNFCISEPRWFVTFSHRDVSTGVWLKLEWECYQSLTKTVMIQACIWCSSITNVHLRPLQLHNYSFKKLLLTKTIFFELQGYKNWFIDWLITACQHVCCYFVSIHLVIVFNVRIRLHFLWRCFLRSVFSTWSNRIRITLKLNYMGL